MIIISWNINNDYRNINNKLEDILNLINEFTPDMIGLQEVIPNLYDLIKDNKIIKNKYIISKKENKSYFNLLLSRYKNEIISVDFKDTNMNRNYILQKNEDINFINIHLESLPCNKEIRNLQINQLLQENKGNLIIFGDTNYIFKDEKISDFQYLQNNDNKDVFTFDSKINRNAMPPFRSNLDRFYTNINIKNYELKILTNYISSDHFPLFLSFQ
jgi:endonuclease/exonuclease/phosphatase family metal-dependent hydrolase